MWGTACRSVPLQEGLTVPGSMRESSKSRSSLRAVMWRHGMAGQGLGGGVTGHWGNVGGAWGAVTAAWGAYS